MTERQDLPAGLIVSCQASNGSPLCHAETMARIARAVVEAGAVGIRANGAEHVTAIRTAVDVPVVALNKVDYPDSPVRITPTCKDAEPLLQAGASIVAIDATNRHRPGSESLQTLISFLNLANVTIVADVDTAEAGCAAFDFGASAIATTLAGYTTLSGPSTREPNIALVGQLRRRVSGAVIIAEGRYASRAEVQAAFHAGAHAVVVGTAITDLAAITRSFIADR